MLNNSLRKDTVKSVLNSIFHRFNGILEKKTIEFVLSKS